ncbi:MAG: alpha/beta hydrolase, partial [[Mycobacterium] stephanolepidis]
WKPVGGFPVRFGWISAIRRGHAELHRGLDVGVPNVILRSDRSLPGDVNPAAALHGDAVLDVQQIARWAGCIGNHQRVIPIPDAKHDVFLSVAEARIQAYRELNSWLNWYEAGS